jgi:hypothetical protein
MNVKMKYDNRRKKNFTCHFCCCHVTRKIAGRRKKKEEDYSNIEKM